MLGQPIPYSISLPANFPVTLNTPNLGLGLFLASTNGKSARRPLTLTLTFSRRPDKIEVSSQCSVVLPKLIG